MVALICAVGCRKTRPPAAEPGPTPCRVNEDCAGGWVCLQERCADPSEKGLYTHPADSVTPEKVKKEVEDTLQREHDKTLQGPE